jgi:hypothetical protein
MLTLLRISPFQLHIPYQSDAAHDYIKEDGGTQIMIIFISGCL